MESPDSGTRTRSVESAGRATSSSDCPTPTVSISSRSKPKASRTSATSRVAAARPPSEPRVAIDRMNTPGSSATFSMRTRSPRSAPPVNGEVGSTAMTPTRSPASRKLFTNRAVIVLLPAPGGPVIPIRLARPVREWSDERICSKPSRWFSTMLTTRASAAGLPASKSASSRSEDTRENPLLFSPHRRRPAAGAFRMVVPEYVQRPMDHQAQNLFAGAHLLTARILARDLGTDINVPEYGPTSSDAAEAEGDHVGRTAVSEITLIQPGDRRAPHE